MNAVEFRVRTEYLQWRYILRPLRYCTSSIFGVTELLLDRFSLSLSPVSTARSIAALAWIQVRYFLCVSLRSKGYYLGRRGGSAVDITASMCSIRGRERSLIAALQSLVLQAYPVARIMVFVESGMLQELRRFKTYRDLEELGVETIESDSIYASHRKYMYQSESSKDSYILTCDDDMIYDKWIVADLVHSLRTTRARVCTAYSWVVEFEEGGSSGTKIVPATRRSWKKARYSWSETIQSASLLNYVDGAYTLYAPSTLTDDIFNKEEIVKYTFFGDLGRCSCDDDWIKWHLFGKNIRVAAARPWCRITNIPEYPFQGFSHGSFMSLQFVDGLVRRLYLDVCSPR